MADQTQTSTGQIVDGRQPKAAPPPLNPNLMHIKVYSPYKIYFDDDAESISAVSGTGNFDILPRHHNFMTLLKPCDIIVRAKGKEHIIRINQGVMHVKSNQAIVFLDV